MKPGFVRGCRKGSDCRFRQPGTWVVECEEFEERPVPCRPAWCREGSLSWRNNVRTSLAHE